MPDPSIGAGSAAPADAAPSPGVAGVDLRWYRSLYWRFALGLFAFLALMLAAEASLLLWTTDRIAGSMPARSPRRLAVLVASDIGSALEAEPDLDIASYVKDQYGHVLQPFLVVLRDGRVFANHDDISADILAAARDAQQRGQGRRLRRFGGRVLPDDGDAPPDSSPGPDGPFRRRSQQPRLVLPGDFATILIAGVPVGRVIVLPAPPFSRVVREFGPRIAVIAGGVLGVGTAVIALIVFGPARRRLRHLQHATERLGSGDLGARAPEDGGDEVAALARSFNRMAQELRERANALAASDRARRQLLADVSHELMTPLTAMRGYIETLGMTELRLDEPTRERYLAIVTEETHRLERIIGDLLDLARLEGGGTAVRREAVPVAMLFDRVAERHDREFSARGIHLDRRIEPSAAAVWGDPDRLEQVLQNLAANALRHTPNGGRIGLAADPLDGQVRLTVRDSGPGIEPAHLPLIFDRFYKVDAARKAAGGSGLGLSIARAIVERHGGTISARNDDGAVFEVTLPAGRIEA